MRMRGQDQTVDFKKRLIVMTSNLASQSIQELGESDAKQFEKRSSQQAVVKCPETRATKQGQQQPY